MPAISKAVSVSIFRLLCGWTRTFYYLKASTAQMWHSQHCVEKDCCLLACGPLARCVCVTQSVPYQQLKCGQLCYKMENFFLQTGDLNLKLRTNTIFFRKLTSAALSDITKYRWHWPSRRSGTVTGYFSGNRRFAGRGWFSYLLWGASRHSHRGH